MKQSFSKDEIRELVREILQDKWKEFLGLGDKSSRDTGQNLLKKPIKKAPSEDDLYNNLDLWIDSFVDDTGRYAGPSVGQFRDRSTFIRDPNQEITVSDLRFLEDWNEAYADKHGLSHKGVWKANREARDSFQNRGNALGSFPT